VKKKKGEQEGRLLEDFCEEISKFLKSNKSEKDDKRAKERRWKKYGRLFN